LQGPGALCGASRNRWMIQRKLRLFCVFIVAALINRGIAIDLMARRRSLGKRIFRGRPFTRQEDKCKLARVP